MHMLNENSRHNELGFPCWALSISSLNSNELGRVSGLLMQCNFPPFYGYVYMHLANPHHPYDKEVLKKQVC